MGKFKTKKFVTWACCQLEKI